jgi:hypothetical protein
MIRGDFLVELMVKDMPKKLALDEPPGGPCKDLARIVREMVKGLTLRQMANHAGSRISIDTIRRAIDGQRVGPQKLDILARSFGRNPNELRIAAGHGLLPEYPDPRTDPAPPGKTPAVSATQYTPEGNRIDAAYPDGRPIPLPMELLKRFDFEIRLLKEKDETG